MGRKSKYEFSTYEVGEKRLAAGGIASVSSCACIYGKKNNKKFSVKKTDDGVEVTRVA